MKKGNKKGVILFSAMMVAVILVLSCVLLPKFGVRASDVLFEDSFTSSLSNDWYSQSVGTITDGKYVLNKGESNYVSDSIKTKNTIVSADVSLTTVKGENKNGYVSVVSRVDPGMNTGYGMAIGVSKTGSTYARLYRMGTDGESEIMRQLTDNIPGIGKIRKNKTYTLTLAIYDNRIIGLINGNIFADVTDDTCVIGYSGVKADGVSCTVDNFKLQETPAIKAERMELISHSDKVAPYEKIYFEIDVTYNSIYGATTINQDTEGVEVSGYDGKPGSKKVTVSYMGGKSSFYVLIRPTYQQTTLWEDNFSKGALSEKYTGGSYTANTEKNYQFVYAFEQKNNMAHVGLPDMDGGDVYAGATLYVPSETAEEWDCYSIKTEVTLRQNIPTPTRRYAHAAIVFAKEQIIWQKS